MNERIKELAEQAFQPINDISTEGVADRYTFEQTWFQMYNQKFTELIVRECIRLCDQVDLVGADECIDNIKEHFEIK